jgi:hypothetical protein
MNGAFGAIFVDTTNRFHFLQDNRMLPLQKGRNRNISICLLNSTVVYLLRFIFTKESPKQVETVYVVAMLRYYFITCPSIF